MNNFNPGCVTRRLLLIVIAGGALMFCSLTMATEAITPAGMSALEKDRPGPVGLSVSGASAGITTEYFKQAVADALVVSGIFSGIENSNSTEIVMPMIRAKGVFSGIDNNSNAPYLLTIRVTKVETPSFSIRMTVGMHAIWTLYRTDGKIELLHENIYSTYTGGVFEGGFSGANRVRVAMEGAERESIRIGIGMLESLDLEKNESQVEEPET